MSKVNNKFKEIEAYIGSIANNLNEVISSGNDIDLIMLNGLNLSYRIAIEKAIKCLDDYLDIGNVTKYINTKLDFHFAQYWLIINQETHDETLTNRNVLYMNSYFIKLYDKINEINRAIDLPKIDVLRDFLIEKDLPERIKVDSGNGSIVIIQKVDIDIEGHSLYKYNDSNDEYATEKYIYVPEDVFMYSNCEYEISYDIYNFRTDVSTNPVDYEVKELFLTDAKIKFVPINNDNFHLNGIIRKIYETYNVPPLVFYNNCIMSEDFNNDAEALKNGLLDLFSQMDKNRPFHNLFTELISLKFGKNAFDLHKLRNYKWKKNDYPNYIFAAIGYEFWTKSPQLFSFTLWEKEVINELIKDSKVYEEFLKINSVTIKNPFHSKLNSYLDRYLISNNALWTDNGDYINGDYSDENFDNNHKEFKTERINIENTEFITLNKYHSGINEFKSLIKDSEFNVDIDLNNLVGIYNSSSRGFKFPFEDFVDLFKKKFTYISSPAGFGKTQLISEFVSLSNDYFNLTKENILLISPTYKSFGSFEEKGVSFAWGSKITSQKFSSKNKSTLRTLEEKISNSRIVIIEEFSMIDIESFKVIIEMINENIQNINYIIILGDHQQIKPIKSQSVYPILEKFAIKNRKILKDNYRQSGQLSSYMKKVREEKKLIFDGMPNIVDTYQNSSEFINYISNNNQNFDVFLTPFHYGIYGRKFINKIIFQSRDNEEFNIGDEVVVKVLTDSENHKELIHNDAILKIKNKVNLGVGASTTTMFVFDKNINEPDITIGDGWIIKDKKLCYEASQHKIHEGILPFHRSNVVTFHSSQGSTYDSLIVIIPPGSNLEFNNIYTAISRISGSNFDKIKVLVSESELNNFKKKTS